VAPGPRSRLALGDLLAEGAYGLRLLSGEEAAVGRGVAGAHVVEVEAPTRFLEPDWVMLTTGVRLRGSPAAQRDLVRELADAGVSALGFGEGVVVKRVPAALVEAGAEQGFPVFAVPYETPFRDIVHYIESSLASDEVGVFRRLTALQRYLVDALSGSEPERVMAERLGRFLDAAVVVVGADGAAEIVVGRPPVAELCAEVSGREPALVEIETAACDAVATPIAAPDDAPTRWLVLAGRRPGRLDRLVKPAAEAGAPLLAALARLGDVARAQEQAVRGALLEEALAPAEERGLTPLAARAAAFGVDFARPARIVVARAAADGEADLDRAARGLGARLVKAGAPHLATRRPRALTLLVQPEDDADLAAALAPVAADHPALAIGVGRAVVSIAEARDSLRDAALAAERAAAAGDRPGGRIVHFEDLDLGEFVVSEIGPERLRPKVAAPLAVLRGNPPLAEALTAYFEHDLDIVAAANALHLHPNSVRYRLSRVEQLIGRPLRSPATIAELHIAMIAGRGS
jgi:purine catabolism regulatory family protein/PucR-like helix-turn-helix protein/diguanylate cyclase with GGDEF domain